MQEKMTIYLDVVFIENVCMNSIILFATGLVTKTKCRTVRIIISSTLGALYVIGKYLENNQILSNIFMQVGLSIAMIYLAFKPNSIKSLFKYIIIFYLTSFVFGGCAFALLYYVKPQDILYKNGQLTGTYPIKIAFLGAIIGAVILKIAFNVIKNRLSKNDMFCDVTIGYMRKKSRNSRYNRFREFTKRTNNRSLCNCCRKRKIGKNYRQRNFR